MVDPSAADSDAPLKQHLALAMLMAWVTPEKPFEPSGLTELTEQERTVVSIVYDHFKSLGGQLDDGGGEADLLEALAGIIDAVEGESQFQISRMELCSWVRDFGDVDVIEPLTFSPKERPRFIWYVELDGVSPTENVSTGEWTHEFDVKVEVLTKDTGIPVISPIVDPHSSFSIERPLGETCWRFHGIAVRLVHHEGHHHRGRFRDSLEKSRSSLLQFAAGEAHFSARVDE